jgi:hypothetical protein
MKLFYVETLGIIEIGTNLKKENIKKFEKLHIEIKDIYEELVYYLKFINQLIEESNSFLSDCYKPFGDFERFKKMTYHSTVMSF